MDLVTRRIIKREHGEPVRITDEELMAVDVPVVPDLARKIVARVDNGIGVLGMEAWHQAPPDAPECGTTHCLAGWAIHLAGRRGYDLERKYGPSMAGALIWQASTGEVPDFYDDTNPAWAWLLDAAKRGGTP